jgi:hypothetical protein
MGLGKLGVLILTREDGFEGGLEGDFKDGFEGGGEVLVTDVVEDITDLLSPVTFEDRS